MYYKFIIFAQCLFSLCLSELSIERKEKLLNGLIVYYNNLPNQTYTCDQGVLQNAQQIDGKTFKVEVNLKVSEVNNLDAVQFLTCTATVQDLQENGITVVDNDMKCDKQQIAEDTIEQPKDGQVEVTESAVERKPVQLDNEIQTNSPITSGEQFIAIPRTQPSTPCIGCSVHVNPQAAGVSDLVNLGIKHIDKHEPTTTHTLKTILDVERQVQVVNGIRYILTLLINFNNCNDSETEACVSTRACKISVLVKPWMKLPSGNKYRSIIANNCTEEWLFGSDGEVLPEDLDKNSSHNQIDDHPSKGDSNDEVKIIHNSDVQSQPNQEKTLTDKQVKNIEEQIIPLNQFHQMSSKIKDHELLTDSIDIEMNKQHIIKDEFVKHNNENSLPFTESRKSSSAHEYASNHDKKQAIDDMLDFFNFAGFKPHSEVEEVKLRTKRSYDYDLQVSALVEKYRDVKKILDNAKFVYTLAQVMVEHLNEMDISVKNRLLKNVLAAEEEFENYEHFVYIQALVIIPCNKAECKSEEATSKICNGVIDSTDKESPFVLNAFCYTEYKGKPKDNYREVPVNDLVLQNLIKIAIRKIESESSYVHAIRLNKVFSANTQQASGTVTKIVIMIDYINCNKSVPYLLKTNCTVLEQVGSSICEIIIHDRHWLKEKKTSYTCTDIPVHLTISKEKQLDENITSNDLQILEMLREALQQLEMESNRNNKQKIFKINSISSQIIAGFVTKIEFLVGYTTCTNMHVSKQPSHKCDFLPNERFRKCFAYFWDRAWIEEGRQMKVECDDNLKKSEDTPEQNIFTDAHKFKIMQQNYRAKRQLSSMKPKGVPVKQDPSAPKIRRLAEDSLRKYVESTGNTNPLKVIHIDKAETLVVSGLKTTIDFVVGESENSENYKCRSQIWEQAWVNKKEINVNCDVIKKKNRVKRDLIGTRPSKKNKTGSKIIQDPTNQEYKLLAEESLRKYERLINSAINHRIIEVKHVESQLVSGVIYMIDYTATASICSPNTSEVVCNNENDIIYCHTRILSKPWLRKKKIDVSCYADMEDNDENYNVTTRQMSIHLPTSIVGALTKKNTNNPLYITLAKEALSKYLSVSNLKYVHKIIEIHSVREQIVEGKIITLEYSVSPTICLVNLTRENVSNCEIKKPQVTLRCTADIWDRPWLQKKDIKVNCKKENTSRKRDKRDTTFRDMRQTGADDDYVDEEMSYYYGNRALKYVNDMSRGGHLHKLVTIHAVQHSIQMKTSLIRMFIEIAETYCLKHKDEMNLQNCEEMDGLNHKLCLAKLWPSPDDELVIRHVSVICDDDDDFDSISGLHLADLLRMSISEYEKKPDVKFKTVHQGEPHIIPSLDPKTPVIINFLLATTNCSKNVNLTNSHFGCFIDGSLPSKTCTSYTWLMPNGKSIRTISVSCSSPRSKRSTSDITNTTTHDVEIQKLLKASLEKLEMQSLHRYKQRVLQVNSHSTKITSGKVTTIDFDVGYTSCLKYEWVENITSCDFIEHLPRRHCIAQIWERLWLNNGRNIDIRCEDDETPLEAHIEFESAEMAMELARAALRHIEAKYPHPKKQKVVRLFSLEKQVVAGIHYRMKIEVGLTDCLALSAKDDCKLLDDASLNKFCRVNVWIRPWTEHPPNFRVSCDYQEGANTDLYRNIQAEHLFYDFITTYSPDYMNDHNELRKRFDIFKENVRKMHEFNIYEKGTARYGVTRFADLTYEEFQAKYTGLKTNLWIPNHVPMSQADVPILNIPEMFDWRDYDAVTEVKDQGSCGSCWAFSVTGNIEGQWKMQSGKLVSLSEQELVDCDKLDEGCNGGLPDNAYRAIEQLGGLEAESDYPYEAEGDKCQFNKTMAKVQITGAVNISSNETNMAMWLLHNGPISIGINANAMQFYMGGISHPWKMLCNPTNLDHGVLIVGFGIKDYPLFNKRLPYWIVKNSWGKSWGEQGYYRVFRGDGTCGVNQMASSAVI